MALSFKKGAYFSPSTASFYLIGLRTSYESQSAWPEDAVAVSDAVFEEYALTTPPVGKIRGSQSGNPCWVAAS